MQFLSTPSARRATRQRGPCRHHRSISIHALREEGDRSYMMASSTHEIFLSTPSARRATFGRIWTASFTTRISIHALREEGDQTSDRPPCPDHRFLSTPSARRATRGSLTAFLSLLIFLSTPSARRATLDSWHYGDNYTISIHALREEGDSVPTVLYRFRPYFYPRPPRGGRQQKQRQNLYFQTNYTTFCTNLEEP